VFSEIASYIVDGHIETSKMQELVRTLPVLAEASYQQGVAVCCTVLQCVALCCSVLPVFAEASYQQGVAVCCSVLQCVALCCSVLPVLAEA